MNCVFVSRRLTPARRSVEQLRGIEGSRAGDLCITGEAVWREMAWS